MSNPTAATVKRLFAVSSNRCAFPRCVQTLVHGDKVTGRICHIKGRSASGPRYDKSQSDVDRHGFDNLLLMCPIHHDVVDSDVVAYTPERLHMMKVEHEAASTMTAEISDRAAMQMIMSIGSVDIENGSVVITNNQSGGQAAHIINNFGPPRRTISSEVRGKILVLLRAHPMGTIGFASTQGDTEANEYKEMLWSLFREAGWNTHDMGTFMFFGSKRGLVVTIPSSASESGSPQIVMQALHLTGNPVEGNRGDMANECQHYVQVWNAP